MGEGGIVAIGAGGGMRDWGGRGGEGAREERSDGLPASALNKISSQAYNSVTPIIHKRILKVNMLLYNVM